MKDVCLPRGYKRLYVLEPVVIIHNVNSNLFDEERHKYADAILSVESTPESLPIIYKRSRNTRLKFPEGFKHTHRFREDIDDAYCSQFLSIEENESV